MSIAAVSWALYKAPARNPSQRLVLAYLADHADRDGHGAYPRAATVAGDLGMSERTVLRHTSELQADGAIRLGDQRIVSHVRADRRPTVWDMNLTLVRPDPGEAADDGPAAPKGGTRKPAARRTPRPVTSDTPQPPHDLSPVTPRGDERPVTSDTPWGRREVPSTAPRGATGGSGDMSPMAPRGGPIRNEPSLEPSTEPPPPTPSIDDQAGGGVEVSDVLGGVAAAWGGSAKALTPHRRLAAAALAGAWQPGALTRHLADSPPPVIIDAARLLGHRLGQLPESPEHCGRRCCAPPPARLTAVPGPWDRPALHLRPPGECEHGAPTGNGCALCRRGIPAERDAS